MTTTWVLLTIGQNFYSTSTVSLNSRPSVSSSDRSDTVSVGYVLTAAVTELQQSTISSQKAKGVQA